MKNKKGFTLIEIIIVIAMVAAISISSTIAFTKTMEKTNEKKITNLINEIELATDVYFNLYPYLMESLYEGSTGDTVCTRVYKLQNEGLIDRTLVNPNTNEPINGTRCVYSTLDENGNIVHEFTLN